MQAKKDKLLFLIDKSGHFATVKRVHVDNVQNNYKVNLFFLF